AWKQAKQLNRPVLLHFHAVWCGPCQQMEREVLNTPAVLHELNACCVAVKIDCDQQPVLVQQFGVESLPCDVLVTPDLKMHRVNQGFVPADRYPSLISQAVKQKTEARIQVSAK
ncbi:MAG: thioredoxin family protein, partial [Deltaproteobacteria bacterium]